MVGYGKGRIGVFCTTLNNEMPKTVLNLPRLKPGTWQVDLKTGISLFKVYETF